MRRIALAAALMLGLTAMPALAQAPTIQAKDAWARATASTAKVGGVFMTLTAAGGPDKVVSATTPVSGPAGVWAVALALLVHAASKSITAGLTGGMAYLRWLAPGLWLHTGLVAAGLVWFSS